MWIVVTVVLAALAIRGVRAAYVAYLLFAVLLIPARVGFQIQPLVCEFPVSVASGLYSLPKWGHVLPSALLSLTTLMQFRQRGARALLWAVALTLGLGLVAEFEQGVFRNGNCRMRDLIPDAAGAFLGAAIGWAWSASRRSGATGGLADSGA